LRDRIAGWLLWVVVGILVVATWYEAAVALGMLSLGPSPGEGPRGETLFFAAAFLALFFSGLLLVACSLRRTPTRLAPVPLVSLTAVSFVVARYSSYDPYYAPSLRRMSDGGIVSGGWIVFLVGLALVAAWSTYRDRRLGMILTSAVCWLSALTGLVSGAGH
jgi:hypothetical protein